LPLFSPRPGRWFLSLSVLCVSVSLWPIFIRWSPCLHASVAYRV
jgi:hypothetical protein